tara:strand:- start:1786 stop:3408 length:1623 start_codon:yes stop_codon:yes gene_type:complete
MGLAGPNGPTKKRQAELIGGLFLVGARGKFCAVITERQLTIERFDGKGVRLELGAIERMRHLKIPMLPSGIILLGIISIYLGITTILSPMNWLAIGLGASVIISNIVSRYSILAIETGSGDRHLVSGSESNLLKLCLIVDRVRHGSDMQEAVLGLENLDSEIPTFPTLRDVSDQFEKTTIASLPMPTKTNEAGSGDGGLNSVPVFGIGPDSEIFGGQKLSEVKESPFGGTSEGMTGDSNPPQQNAYERAWGVQEAPTWYKEKEPDERNESRIDSAFSDAAESLDMFAPGGIFDSVPVSEVSDSNEMGLFDFDFEAPVAEPVERPHSSSQMIKRAHQEFGAPSEPFPRTLLPPPTEEAVREECKAGVVRQARAKQELRIQNLNGTRTNRAANLDDYPALKGLASTMSGSSQTGGSSTSGISGGWLSRLLRPGSSVRSRGGGDSGAIDEIETERFQTTQHMRLRSDQDHQGDISARVRAMRKANPPSTARDKLDLIVKEVAGETRDDALLPDISTDSLRFSQLNPTSSKEDPHPLPGLRRLG